MKNDHAADRNAGATPAASGWFARRGGILAAIGGCAFAVFWLTVVFDIPVPWMVSLPFHGFAMVNLAAGVIALQQAQTRARPGTGWSWIPSLTVSLSVFVSFEVFLIGTIVFALTAIKLNHLAKRGAVALTVGALLFLLGFFLHGSFWSENDPDPPLPVALVFAAGLLVMAAGWVVLGTDHARRENRLPRRSDSEPATAAG